MTNDKNKSAAERDDVPQPGDQNYTKEGSNIQRQRGNPNPTDPNQPSPEAEQKEREKNPGFAQKQED